MILDADLTVPPEDLPSFFDALDRAKGDFINGVRLVYPMEEEAMRFCNLLGNKFFSLAFSLAARPADQGHAVRHQSALAAPIMSASPPIAPTSATSIPSAISICSSARRG